MDAKRRLQMLQKNCSNIRNICILAHVDHGKAWKQSSRCNLYSLPSVYVQGRPP